MKIGCVIGRVTLSHREESYRGGRFFVVVPATREHLLHAKPDAIPKGNSLIVYDDLGASPCDLIAFSEGGEAGMAFAEDTPVDAYNCMILDSISYQPPESTKRA
jgi:microcompartment protein CcmK/EutM